MIIDPTHFINYYSLHNTIKIFYSDEYSDQDLLFADIWKKILPTSSKFLCFAHIDTYKRLDVLAMSQKLEQDKQSPVIIFLTGQQVDTKIISEIIDSRENNVFIINDNGFTDKNYFAIDTAHRAWKGYIGAVPFIPHADRAHTLSALCHRYETHRWLLLAKIKNHKINSCLSFHNINKISLESFYSLCQAELAMTPDDAVMQAMDQLIKDAPITPKFLSNPNGGGSVYNQWQQTDLSAHISSRINATLEGSYIDTGTGVNLTEKMAKCLAAGTFPLHIGQTRGYDRLREWGFNGFEQSGLDLSYDQMQGDFLSAKFRSDKIKKIYAVIESISDELNVEQVCKNNYDWFHGGWYDHCESQNEPEIQRLQEDVNNCI